VNARQLGCGMLLLLAACDPGGAATAERPAPHWPPVPADAQGLRHVYPGESIQAALEAAADDPEHKRVAVHAGSYRPDAARQALIWFNARHDGVVLEALGHVVLSAANPDAGNPSRFGFPALVNHVVYFGDGVGPDTVLRGFEITGANGFVTRAGTPPSIQPPLDAPRLQPTTFFYTDGGGIKIFGRSYPTIERVSVVDNYASPCGAGVSIEHRGYTEGEVVFRDCIFRDNRSPLTGAAVDLLDHELGSAAVFLNCLFVGNASNSELDKRGRKYGKWKPLHGCGALTVFPHSRVRVDRCTFTDNRNAVDDSASGNRYTRSIFWRNQLPGGWAPEAPYELDLADGDGVSDCVAGGDLVDLRGSIPAGKNDLAGPEPGFDQRFVPQHPAYAEVGYRPPEQR